MYPPLMRRGISFRLYCWVDYSADSFTIVNTAFSYVFESLLVFCTLRI